VFQAGSGPAFENYFSKPHGERRETRKLCLKNVYSQLLSSRTLISWKENVRRKHIITL